MKQRLDHWLWCARFFKSRSLAAKICRARKVRIDGVVQNKASASVVAGFVLTFPQAARIRIIKVVALSEKRGPAPVARLLYEDLSPPVPAIKMAAKQVHAKRETGSGRPTKADRRAIDKLRQPD